MHALLRESNAAREESLAQLETAQDRAASLEAQLEEAAAASKRKNSSAWRLRQENQQLKAELSAKSASLNHEFKQRQEIREAAEMACERTKTKAATEMEMAHSVARQAHAAASQEVSRAGQAAAAAVREMENAMMSQMQAMSERVLNSLSEQASRVARLQTASTRVKTELITAQRAAVVAGMEAAQAETEMAEAEAACDKERKLREGAEQRTALVMQRLEKGRSPASICSPERTEWSASTTRAGQRPGKLEEALAEAVAAKGQAERTCVDAEAKAMGAEARAKDAEIAAREAVAKAKEAVSSAQAEAADVTASAKAEIRASAALRLAAESEAFDAKAEVRRLRVRVTELERGISVDAEAGATMAAELAAAGTSCAHARTRAR
eukprot:COSAG05_NODE_903_length_6662_cov_2.632333_5_plen_382_part_00